MSPPSLAMMSIRMECYLSAPEGTINSSKIQQRKRRSGDTGLHGKTTRITQAPSFKKCQVNGFDSLPEDLLINILTAVASTASSPADLFNAMLTCRRFLEATKHPQVLSNASSGALAVKAASWTDGADRFLRQCADAGNTEACYSLGMIRFYCLRARKAGASLMAKAAMKSHSAALHSLAVIQFNGSGGTRKDKDLKAGVALCVRAATLGHVDAMRELGHCLQDGYGISKNLGHGRRLLLEANAREAAAAVVASPTETALQFTAAGMGVGCSQVHQSVPANTVPESLQRTITDQSGPTGIEAIENQQMYKLLHGGSGSLLSDFGCMVPSPKLHLANNFLVDWFASKPPESGLRLCSHIHCGRPETRRHEFRRCSACGSVNYCSRACQALDWKIVHKYRCHPVADWGDRQDDNDVEEDDAMAFEGVEAS